ncbi:hypothetical protein Nepgr_023232 [Nepenthes gracilis]|uniref:Uncharacterized protein n=1 Tax=Nepenthes gracilis TaxID=150966 RepID=A0AAD3XYX3_NEPGR|nr:hypothetical protein Nepgr_023232 [Nepenthes gracilis]
MEVSQIEFPMASILKVVTSEFHVEVSRYLLPSPPAFEARFKEEAKGQVEVTDVPLLGVSKVVEVAAAESSEPEVHEVLEVPISDTHSVSYSISEDYIEKVKFLVLKERISHLKCELSETKLKQVTKSKYRDGIGLYWHINKMVAPSSLIFIFHPRNASVRHSSDVLYYHRDDVES